MSILHLLAWWRRRRVSGRHCKASIDPSALRSGLCARVFTTGCGGKRKTKRLHSFPFRGGWVETKLHVLSFRGDIKMTRRKVPWHMQNGNPELKNSISKQRQVWKLGETGSPWGNEQSPGEDCGALGNQGKTSGELGSPGELRQAMGKTGEFWGAKTSPGKDCGGLGSQGKPWGILGGLGEPR